MTAQNPIDGVLEQLAAAKQQIEGRMLELAEEAQRIDAAIATLQGTETNAPDAERSVSEQRPAADPDLPRAGTIRQASDAPLNTGPAGQRQRITDEEILDAIRKHEVESDDGWISGGPLVEYLGIGKSTLPVRLRALIDQGALEARGTRGRKRYRLLDAERAVDDAGIGTSAGKGDQAHAPRPVDGSLSVEEEEDEDTEDDGDEQAAAISSRTRRQLEHESRPAVPKTPGRRLSGESLRRKIDELLRRSEPWTTEQLARSLVVPVAEVRGEIQTLFQIGAQGRGPKPLRHPTGGLSIPTEEAQQWPLERAA